MKLRYLEIERSNINDCIDAVNDVVDAENIINIETTERTENVFGYDEYDSGTENRVTVKVFYRVNSEY